MELHIGNIITVPETGFDPAVLIEGAEGCSSKLQIEECGNKLIYHVTLRNDTAADIYPKTAALRLGINCYMAHYLEWNDRYFPSMLRVEKTHLWGYFMSPVGKVIGIASRTPVAAWRLVYNRTSDGGDFGHRIYTADISLLNTLPLPERHPQDLNVIRAGAEMSWEIILFECPSFDEFEETLWKETGIPTASLVSYNLTADERPEVRTVGVNADSVEIDDDGSIGAHAVRVRMGDYLAECTFCRRRPWGEYLRLARKEALSKPQRATTHTESWYGFFSGFLAAKRYPDKELDSILYAAMDEIFPLIHDPATKLPTVIPHRIQNTALMISLLVDRYESNPATQRESLETAAVLGDWLMGMQGEDGAYYNRGHHYTCVIYLAKAMLELALCEKKCAENAPDSIFAERYARHYGSAHAAVDNLVKLGEGIGTEGEHTFEDGMISCASLQIGMFALTLPEEARAPYIKAARHMLTIHRCLELRRVPDGRMRGATLRFWEAQYDVMTYANFLTSPHGWTGWKNYASYYLYLLTGEEEYLRDLYETMGACVQLIGNDGELNWAFCVDPYVTACRLVPDTAQPVEDAYQALHVNEPAYRGKYEDAVFGECYLPMVSGWYRPAKGTPVMGGYATCPLIMDGYNLDVDPQGGACDNDVHENFKCLEETILGKVFINVRGDGSVSVYNGKLAGGDAACMEIASAEDVDTLYVNSKEPVTVKFRGETYENVRGFVSVK